MVQEKSTTMNMLTGFIEPSEGSIIINGKDIVKKAREAKKKYRVYARKCSFIFRFNC